MKIRDVLQLKDAKHREPITIVKDEMVPKVAKKLIEYDRGAFSVVDEEGNLIGIVTERDVVRKCTAEGNTCSGIRVEDIMTKSVITGTPEDDSDYVIGLMKTKRIRHLPIVEGGNVVGMISMRDLLGLELDECKIQSRYSHLIPVKAHTHQPGVK